MEKRSSSRMLGSSKLVTLVAAILSLCLMAMLICQGVQKAQADPFNPERKSHLNIQLSDDAGDVKPSDLGLWYKLYKVANVVPQAGYDAYKFEFITGGMLDIDYKDDIESLNSITSFNNEGSAEKYRELANTVAKVVYDANGSIVPAYNLEANGAADNGVMPGLYLVVPYGSDTIPEGSSAATNVLVPNDSKTAPYPYVSNAYTATQRFVFNPQLLALPTTNSLNSADANGWIYNPTITLKPSIEPRKGSLIIDKLITVGEYNDQNIGNNEVTFVFDIEGYDASNNLVYSNVASVVINTKNGNSGAAVITNIPAGLRVVVSERYTGSSYEGVTGEQTVTIKATDSTLIGADKDSTTEGAETVKFQNTYNGNGNKGGSVTNSFQNTNGEWVWSKDGVAQNTGSSSSSSSSSTTN